MKGENHGKKSFSLIDVKSQFSNIFHRLFDMNIFSPPIRYARLHLHCPY